MKRFRWVSIALAASLLAVSAAVADTASLFGRATGVFAPALSPDGQRVATGCSPQGSPSICIFDISGAGSEPIYVPVDGRLRLEGFYWANDRFLIFVVSQFDELQTVDGMQEYDFRRAIAYDLQTDEAVMLMRNERFNLDTASVVSLLPGDEEHVLILSAFSNIARGRVTAGTYKVNLRTGRARRGDGFAPAVERVIFNREGDIVAELVRTGRGSTSGGVGQLGQSRLELNSDGETLIAVESEGVDPFYVFGYDEAAGQLLAFFEDGERDGLHHISPEDGTITPIALKGAPAGRLATVRDPLTRGVVGFAYMNDLPGQVFVDPTLRGAHEALAGALPDSHVTLTSWDAARNRIAVRAETAGRPAEYFVFDRNAGTLSPIGSAAAHLQDVPLGQVEAVSYAASDGLPIPAYLTLPPGKRRADGPFPLVVLPHGGPEARDTARFDWWAQALAAEDYAVLQPNFRGSSGYGWAHLSAGFGEFGGRMVTDVADGAAWAVEQGIAKQGGYCAVGASYGGYSALMLAALDPEQVGCVVAVNAVTDPFAINASLSTDAQAARYWDRYLGVGRFADDAQRAAVMPTRRVGEMRADILLLHGREDLRVPFGQARLFANAAEGRSNFRLVPMEGEDHFLLSSSARHTVLSETLAFLRQRHPAQ